MTKSQVDKLSVAKQIVERSGNTFHAKVLTALQDRDWKVLVSPYYSDQMTGKPREIDLIAEKAFRVNDTWGKQKGSIHVQLYVECKFLNQPTVFWIHDQDTESTEKLLERTTPLRSNNIYIREHHYVKQTNGRVVKLFAGQPQSSTEGEQMYKALNQSLNAMIAYKSKGSILDVHPHGVHNVLALVRYPLIVCGNEENMFQIDIGSNDDPVAVDNNMILEVNYVDTDPLTKHRIAYFLIDIVRFDKLDELFSEIDKDVDAMNIIMEG